MFNKETIYINNIKVYFYQITSDNIIARQCIYEWDAEIIIWMIYYGRYGKPTIGKI